jgi:hypothetical protein
VLVVARGDHDGVHPLALEQVAVRDILFRVQPIGCFDLGGGRFAPQAPRVAHRRELDILFLGKRLDPGHVRPDAPVAAADQADTDPFIGSHDPAVTGCAHRQSRGSNGHVFQKSASRCGTIHGSNSPF